MAGGPSIYVANATLNKVLKQTDFTSPTGLWLALFTTAAETFLRSNTIASASEVANTGAYQRMAISFANITTPIGGQIQINTDVTFPTCTGGWGTVYQAALMDTATLGAGNFLWFGPLSASANIQIGDVLKIPAFSFTVTM